MYEKNVLEDLEAGIVGEFLEEIKKKFGGGDNELKKVAELKQVEQGSRIMKEYVQEFRYAARNSRYTGRLLVEEFR